MLEKDFLKSKAFEISDVLLISTRYTVDVNSHHVFGKIEFYFSF